MANRKTLEDSVGTNYSSSSSTTSSSSSSSSPANSSSSSSTSPLSFLFQSISAELDGQLKACPPTRANSTKSGSLLPLPSYREKAGWWCSRPTTNSKNSSIIKSTSTSVLSRPSSFSPLSSSSHCRHHHQNAVNDCKHQQPRRHRQRLKSLTFHLTVALIFTTFSCFPSLVGSTTSTSEQDDNERLVCMEGVSGLPGGKF